MIEGRVIVCLANSWDYDPTSKHQIMRILSRRNTIVWVNYRGTRRPGPTAADLKSCFATLRRVARGTQRISPTLTQVTPLVVPGATSGPLHTLNKRMLIAQVRRALRRTPGAAGKPLQVWTFAPDVPYLVGRFSEECFVYYCVDEYTKFEGFDRKSIETAEGELIDRADLVVTTSQSLYETKRRRRPDVALVRHGVDFEHFASAWRTRLERPADLDDVPEPIFGFFGWIHHWIDLGLIAEVARQRPQYSFVLIGDCGVDAGVLKDLPNVFLLGRRTYESLPAYCAAFAAGLLPFADSAMTRNINPIKMTEYLAAGLPVISTCLPEAKRYEGPISIAETTEQFIRACDAVICGDCAPRGEAISAAVRNQSWEATVEWLSALVMERVTCGARTGELAEGLDGDHPRAGKDTGALIGV